MLLTEFDNDRNAIIEATNYINPIPDFPEIAVSCFSYVTFERLLSEYDHTIIATINNANGPIHVYRITDHDMEFAVFKSDVGAAGCVGVLEDLIALGAKRLVLFGTCGVLDRSISDASIIIPTAALRDEGTSYHYKEASDEIETNRKFIPYITELLDQYNINYSLGKAWTTDAFYRETKGKMTRRKEQGCICVDMECSAVAAWAEFRNIDVFHFFYAADNLDHDVWDSRSLSNHHLVEEKHAIASLSLLIAKTIVNHS